MMEEQSLKAEFVLTCAGRIGWLNLKGPFIRFAVYEDFIVISAYRKILLRFDEIVKVESTRLFLNIGVKIVHRNSKYPDKIILWTSNHEKIKTLLDSKIAGYRTGF